MALGPTFPWRLTLPSSASGSESLRAPRPAQGSTGQHRAGAAAGAPSGLGGGAPESPSRFLLFLGLFQGSASFLPLCSFKTLSLSVSGGFCMCLTGVSETLTLPPPLPPRSQPLPLLASHLPLRRLPAPASSSPCLSSVLVPLPRFRSFSHAVCRFLCECVHSHARAHACADTEASRILGVPLFQPHPSI